MSPSLALAWRLWLVVAAALYAGGFVVALATGARASRAGRAVARGVGIAATGVAAIGAALIAVSLAAGAFSGAGALGPALFGVLPLAMTGLGLSSWARRAAVPSAHRHGSDAAPSRGVSESDTQCEYRGGQRG